MNNTEHLSLPTEDDWDEELRQWLEDYIEENPHHSTLVLSRSQYIGISKPVIDSYLNGKYFLPASMGGDAGNVKTSPLEGKIREFRERMEGTVRHGYAKSFMKTSTWLQLKTAFKIAQKENVIVVVYGKPGVGKSRGMLQFAKKEMVTAPIIILCSRNISAHYFAKSIAKELNIVEKGSLPKLEDLIIEKLRKFPRSLFVDQANYLDEKALGTVCHIWEKCKIPISLVGTKALFDLFMKSDLTEEVRAQLASRVAIHYLLSELDAAEVKTIVTNALGKDATDEIVAQIHNITGAIHRHVDMIIPRILDLKKRNRELIKSGKIQMSDIVNTAGSRLMIG